jgi:hypothetical protein
VNRRPWSAADYPSQISVIDASLVPPLVERLNLLANTLSAALPLQRAQILATISATARVDENADVTIDGTQGDDLIDLGDMGRQLALSPVLSEEIRSAASNLEQAVSNAVVINYRLSGTPWIARTVTWDLDPLSGLSVYFPLQDEWKRPYYGAEALPRFAGPWTDFIQQVYSGQEAPGIPEPCTDAPCAPGSRQGPLPTKRYLPVIQR